jgi:hypothetical protein
LLPDGAEGTNEDDEKMDGIEREEDQADIDNRRREEKRRKGE